MEDGKYGHRTMYLNDKSLFFIEAGIYLLRNLFKTIITHAKNIILVWLLYNRRTAEMYKVFSKIDMREMSFFWLVCVSFDMVKGRTGWTNLTFK